MTLKLEENLTDQNPPLEGTEGLNLEGCSLDQDEGTIDRLIDQIPQNILDEFIDLSVSDYIKAIKELEEILKGKTVFYLNLNGPAVKYNLSQYCSWIDRYPEYVEEVVKDIDLTIEQGKYLGNVLKLLQHISETVPSYKLPSYHVDMLWEILGSNSCDIETKTAAGDLLLQDCSSTKMSDRQEAISKVLDSYAKQRDFIGDESAFLKEFVDKHKNDEALSEEQIDSIKKILGALSKASQIQDKKEFYDSLKQNLEDTKQEDELVNDYSEHVSDTLKKVETDVNDQDQSVQGTDEEEVEYEEEIDPDAKKFDEILTEFLAKKS